MSEFETMRLGELLKFQNGRLSPERFERGKFCVYGSNGVIGRADSSNAPGPSVVIGRVGSYCGSVYFVREDCWVTDNAIQARGIGSMDNRYLYYLALHTGLNNWRTGSGQPLLNQSTLSAIPVQATTDEFEQRAIAEMLGVLDDKIESNNRLADLLIQLARMILETGENEVRLGDIATCDKGLSYKGDGLQEDPSVGLPMVNLANFGVNGWLNSEKLKYYSGEYKERHILKAGDLVVANTDLTQQRIIIGRPALVPPSLGKAIFTHHVTAIRPLNDEKLRLPIWAQLNSPAFRERAEGFATGTTVAGMPVEALLDFNVRIPDEGIISDAQELLERVWVAESESRSLKNAKEILMPELLSGRMRVKDAESMMENV